MQPINSWQSQQNRRETYRQSIQPIETVEVRLVSSMPPLRATDGRVLDLSMGGMAVLTSAAIEASEIEQWMSRFTIRRAAHPAQAQMRNPRGLARTEFNLRSYVVHCERLDEGYYCGVRFIDIDRPYNDAQRKALWQFLLTEQRRWLAIAER